MADLLPSILSGVVALASAAMSFGVALRTIRRAEREHRESHHQQLALALMPRRLDALETAWLALFDLQAGRQLGNDRIQRLVEASMWMPPAIRDRVLGVVAGGDPAGEDLADLRRALVAAAGAGQVDLALSRLTTWEAQ